MARGGLEGRWKGGQAGPSKDQALTLSEVVGLGLVLQTCCWGEGVTEEAGDQCGGWAGGGRRVRRCGS